MRISDDDLANCLSDAIMWVRSPANVGLKAIATIALLVWRADGLGATGPQVRNVILGSDPGKLLQSRFWRGLQLFRFWKKNGLPEQIRISNSLDDARDASLCWLAAKIGITSQEELWKLDPPIGRLDDLHAKDGQVERISEEIAGALRNRSTDYYYTTSEFANAIVNKLSISQAEEFCAAVAQAFSDRVAANQSTIDTP